MRPSDFHSSSQNVSFQKSYQSLEDYYCHCKYVCWRNQQLGNLLQGIAILVCREKSMNQKNILNFANQYNESLVIHSSRLQNWHTTSVSIEVKWPLNSSAEICPAWSACTDCIGCVWLCASLWLGLCGSSRWFGWSPPLSEYILMSRYKWNKDLLVYIIPTPTNRWYS